MGKIKFNDISSDDLGLIIQFIPTYRFAEKQYTAVHIPGQNGEFLIDKGYYKPVKRRYSIAKVFKPGENLSLSASAIAEWLYSADGYARLEDSYEPEYYRIAKYVNEGEMSNYYDQVTALEIEFDCKPERWLISGDIFKDISNNGKIKNPTRFDAKPLIVFKTIAGQKAYINIGNQAIEFGPINESKEITVDCENMECYSTDGLYNSYLALTNGKFPVLPKLASTTITFSNVSYLKIKPRWWTL